MTNLDLGFINIRWQVGNNNFICSRVGNLCGGSYSTSTLSRHDGRLSKNLCTGRGSSSRAARLGLRSNNLVEWDGKTRRRDTRHWRRTNFVEGLVHCVRGKCDGERQGTSGGLNQLNIQSELQPSHSPIGLSSHSFNNVAWFWKRWARWKRHWKRQFWWLE